MRFLFLFLFSCILTVGFSQKDIDLSGCWRGKITQDQGGFRPEYGMELYLTQKGNQITGRSFVYFDKYYAEMELEGQVLGNKIIQFRETKVSAFKKVDTMEWCVKQAVLTLIKSGNPWKLEGAWNGATQFGPCIPGKIFLKKSIPRA
ncbi:MAG: hypothetical protein IPJ74_06160 [Saprospiraceae bacterium]|nr:hypothetical protein [Saprospiraceae bacterium]